MAQSGIDALNNRRTRRSRQAPPSRHPAAPTPLAGAPDATNATAAQPVPDDTEEPVNEASSQPAAPAESQDQEPTMAQPVTGAASDAEGGVPHRVPVATTPRAAQVASKHAEPPSHLTGELPALDIDLRDPDAHIVSPTVMSIPESIVTRFDKARSKAPSHTAVVLNALRQHAHELPALILARRPGPTPGDLFPWRDAPGDSGGETPLPLRIRPTKAELKVMETLQDWSTKQIQAQHPGARKTNRSEMVAAALDAYLPTGGGPTKKQQK